MGLCRLAEYTLTEDAATIDECLLATLDSEPVGILMLKPYVGKAQTCEMNCMFVRPAGRRQGVARALAARMIERARALVYGEMALSTLDGHDEALARYRDIGFLADERRTGADREVQMQLAL